MSSENEISPWVYFKEGFLPTAKRAEIEARRKNERNIKKESLGKYSTQSTFDDPALKMKQAEIAAYYRRLAEERAALMPEPPTPEQQGYRRLYPNR